jgi:hypothetical protein
MADDEESSAIFNSGVAITLRIVWLIPAAGMIKQLIRNYSSAELADFLPNMIEERLDDF